MRNILGPVTDALKKIAGIFKMKDVERVVFKGLLGAWVAVFMVTIVLNFFLKGVDEIESQMQDMASTAKRTVMPRADLQQYEDVLMKVKYPEAVDSYQALSIRNPFNEAQVIAAVKDKVPEYDFSLAAIKRMPLPILYQGFIELPDKVIAQIDWKGQTRFAEQGAAINGYTILSVSRLHIDIRLPDGTEHRLDYQKPLPGDELMAVLYDNISQKKFSVTKDWMLDGYKAVEIREDGVVLYFKGKTIELALP